MFSSTTGVTHLINGGQHKCSKLFHLILQGYFQAFLGEKQIIPSNFSYRFTHNYCTATHIILPSTPPGVWTTVNQAPKKIPPFSHTFSRAPLSFIITFRAICSICFINCLYIIVNTISWYIYIIKILSTHSAGGRGWGDQPIKKKKFPGESEYN